MSWKLFDILGQGLQPLLDFKQWSLKVCQICDEYNMVHKTRANLKKMIILGLEPVSI